MGLEKVIEELRAASEDPHLLLKQLRDGPSRSLQIAKHFAGSLTNRGLKIDWFHQTGWAQSYARVKVLESRDERTEVDLELVAKIGWIGNWFRTSFWMDLRVRDDNGLVYEEFFSEALGSGFEDLEMEIQGALNAAGLTNVLYSDLKRSILRYGEVANGPVESVEDWLDGDLVFRGLGGLLDAVHIRDLIASKELERKFLGDSFRMEQEDR